VSKKWSDRLAGFTALYVLFLIWMPPLMWAGDERDFVDLPPIMMFWYSAVVVLTILAQWGFITIATRLDEAEKGVAQLEVTLEQLIEWQRSRVGIAPVQE
jgi:hypothetical protein